MTVQLETDRVYFVSAREKTLEHQLDHCTERKQWLMEENAHLHRMLTAMTSVAVFGVVGSVFGFLLVVFG